MTGKYATQRRYKNRQQNNRGMVKVAVWVPENDRDKIIELAETLRKNKEGIAHDTEPRRGPTRWRSSEGPYSR